LASRGFDVHVIESGDRVGGNAASFELAGIPVDYGSHRLHPATDPAVLSEIRELLGGDLLERPRHGRIRLLGRWIHFPLRPLDLALRVHPRFAWGVGLDLLLKALPVASSDSAGETFASVLERGLGSTICREFYFPYSRKLWGIEPEEIAATQAHKRVSAASTAKLLRRLFPGGAGSGAASSRGIFLYPRGGFGQISDCFARAALARGAKLHLHASVECVVRSEGGGFQVQFEQSGVRVALKTDRVWSTIPSRVLVPRLDPPAPRAVLEAAGRLELRAMILIYLVLETDRFTEYDAHYFPGEEVRITRLSEPKYYSARSEPRGRTVLCAELPCFPEDDVWSMNDGQLGALALGSLEAAGIPVECPVLEVTTRRLPAAYPVYRTGWERDFDEVDAYLEGLEGIVAFGRQGLFAHDNTHHALFMARAAVSCLRDDGGWDQSEWLRQREVFRTHVVED
jgi:protoporphyrinogen oxidase